MSSRKELTEALAAEEAQLAAIERQREEARVRIDALRTELASLTPDSRPTSQPQVADGAPTPMTVSEKIALYRRLFRGRDDVFARRWANARTGRTGYAPACANEWVRGACRKPHVRCGECPDQAFLPITDDVIRDHLLGEHVIGAYPLLKDDRCWFLAADFDKESWRDDVSAFVQTCRQHDLSPAVERSRSGNGAHVWFFFSAPIAASTARAMGCHLITETMERRHQLGMESYDRLFPNQDVLPQGGFGNLIALPLQREPSQRGNTVFVDDNFQSYPDQWSYLGAVQPIRPALVGSIAAEAKRRGQVVGLQIAGTDDADDSKRPWARRPSRRARSVRISGPLSTEVRAVFAQRLYIEKLGLPSALLNQIKRLAAFQNPEFYKKQNLRLSTALTARVIACADETPQHVGLPRGCWSDCEDLLKAHGIALVIEDRREEGESLGLRFVGDLTSLQQEAARKLLDHDTGILVAPPGMGKTVIGIHVVAQRARSTLVLVHRQPLMDQWRAQMSLFLGMAPKDIGQIGGGKRKPNGKLDVAMIQSLTRKGAVYDLVAGYGQVVVDECHHLPAVSFERVLAECKARYVVGLTATPQRRDGHHPIIRMQCGPIRHVIDPRSKAGGRPFRHRLVVRETRFRGEGVGERPSIQALYRLLASDERRNEMILDDVIGALEEGRSPILLTERRDHLEHFQHVLQGFVRHLVVLRGGMTAKKRREVADQLAAIRDGEERLVLATGRYIGEGFDDARLDTLFLALPISWKGTLVQYAGRLHRLHLGKTEVRIYDYLDGEVPVLARMFERRLRGYRAIGYGLENGVLGLP